VTVDIPNQKNQSSNIGAQSNDDFAEPSEDYKLEA